MSKAYGVRLAAVLFVPCVALLVATSGCEFDTSGEAPSCNGTVCKQKRDAVSVDAKPGTNWQPTLAPATRTTTTRLTVEDAQTAASAPETKPAKPNPDDEDAGEPRKPVSNKPMVMVMTSESGAARCSKSQKEICNTIDDDCDKKVDEDCECPSMQPVACYDGPSGTLDVGQCRAGMRSCAAGKLGSCNDAVLPGVETCNGVDDDCNGVVDDAPGLGSDIENCGRCGHTCEKGESCCAGRCVNPRGDDKEHCGACGNACTAGAMPGCCGGRCVDLLTDQTCGSCTNACGIFKLGGGFICTCKEFESGPKCAARNNMDQWMLCQ